MLGWPKIYRILIKYYLLRLYLSFVSLYRLIPLVLRSIQTNPCGSRLSIRVAVSFDWAEYFLLYLSLPAPF